MNREQKSDITVEPDSIAQAVDTAWNTANPNFIKGSSVYGSFSFKSTRPRRDRPKPHRPRPRPYLSPEEAATYEHELSTIAALNDALESTDHALKLTESSDFWQRLHPIISDAAALLASQIAPILDLNAERHLEMSEAASQPPLALAARSQRANL